MEFAIITIIITKVQSFFQITSYISVEMMWPFEDCHTLFDDNHFSLTVLNVAHIWH